MEKLKENIINQLKNCGIKPTIHRIAVMEILSTSMSHPTAEEIFEQIKLDYPTVSLATVYNTIEILDSHGLIRSIKHNNIATRYDFYQRPHFHLYSKSDGEIHDFEDETLHNLLNDYLSATNIDGYKIKDFNLEIIIEKE